MAWAERAALRRGSPGCPDLLRGRARPALSPLFRSFFEDECRSIAARLLGEAEALPGLSPGPVESAALRPPSAGLVTSTPRESSPPPAAAGPRGAAPLGRPHGEPRRLPLPRAGGCSRLARPQPRRAAPLPLGRPGGRPSLARPGPPGAAEGPGAPATKLPVPQGARLKAMPPAKSRLQHPAGRASQLERPSAGCKELPRDKATETVGKAGGRRQPAQKLPTAIPTVASRSRSQPAGKVASSKCTYLESTPQELVCNRTRELMESDKADQTWVCVESPCLSELHPGPAPCCGDAACAVQPAGCQLSQELEHVKKELERVKGELAEKTAQCEAYCQTISSLEAQLRAAGICPEDAAEDENSV